MRCKNGDEKVFKEEESFELYWSLTCCNFYNFRISGCILISSLASLVGIPIGIASSTIGIKICAITAGIKNYKSIIKKKKKHDKIVLSAKSKLNNIEVSISKTLTDSNIGSDGFVLINNVLKKFYDMKEEIKNLVNKSWNYL